MCYLNRTKNDSKFYGNPFLYVKVSSFPPAQFLSRYELNIYSLYVFQLNYNFTLVGLSDQEIFNPKN